MNAASLFKSCTMYKTQSGIEVIVPKSIFDHILRAALQTVPVDEAWYIARYQDVQMAIEEGTLSSAKNHYVDDGYFEGRLPFAIGVDEDYYREVNMDVDLAIESGDINSAQEHFELSGFSEGRLPYPGFSLFEEAAGLFTTHRREPA